MHAVYYDNVRVPVQNLIGEENQGFLVIMTNFNGERMAMAAGMEALGRVCMEEAVAWARDRKPFAKRLPDPQVIRHKIAQMKQKLNATQAYIRMCYESIEAGNPNPGDIALLKVQASETMEFCARALSGRKRQLMVLPWRAASLTNTRSRSEP